MNALSEDLRRWLEDRECSPHTVRVYVSAAEKAQRDAAAQGWDLLTLDADQVRALWDLWAHSPASQKRLGQVLGHLWDMYEVDGPRVWLKRSQPKSEGETVEGYIDYLLGLGLAPATVRMYVAKFKRAWRWAETEGVDLAHPRAAELVAYRETLPQSHSSIRQARCALVHYWDWVESQGVPVKALRVPKKPRPYWRGLSDDEARRLAEAARGWHPEGTAVIVALYTGLRRAEIAAMRWDRFTPDLSHYTVTGKGSYTATIPIHPDLAARLRPHLGAYVWVFPGQQRLHVSPVTIWDWVRRVADEADVIVTPHRIRHTAIQRVYTATRDIRLAQAFARHQRLDTTQVYTQIDDQDLTDAVANLDWLEPRLKAVKDSA